MHDSSGRRSKQGIVFANFYVVTGIKLGAALAHQNITSICLLSGV
jgi:hypothetical protein